jgi:hypothetical protein
MTPWGCWPDDAESALSAGTGTAGAGMVGDTSVSVFAPTALATGVGGTSSLTSVSNPEFWQTLNQMVSPFINNPSAALCAVSSTACPQQ